MRKRVFAGFLAVIMLLAVVPPTPINAAAFSDLPGAHWAHDQIISLVQQGVINGFPDGTYRPEEAVTREQFARLVVALLDEPSEREAIFDDIPPEHWANPYVTAAVNRGIIFADDYGDNLGVGVPITREEAALWMVRGLGIYTPPAQTSFNDNSAIVNQSEIAAAVEIGLIAGMPGNLFEPQGLATRAQAAVLVTRMAGILAELTWSGEEIHHYVYRDDVVVIENPPSYSFTETDGIFTITVYNPNEAIRSLTVGDTFVLEPSSEQVQGLAGRVLTIDNQNSTTIITARSPESLEEIFYEFHLSTEIDMLAHADEIFLHEALQGVEGIEISRNWTNHVEVTFRDVILIQDRIDYGFRDNFYVRIAGSLRFAEPVVQIEHTLTALRHIEVTMTKEADLTISVGAQLDIFIPLVPIPIVAAGTGVTIIVGIAVTMEGEIYLTYEHNADIRFGLSNPQGRNNAEHFFTQSNESELRLGFQVSAQVTLRPTLDLRVLYISLAGLEANFGKGLRTGPGLFMLCHSETGSRCAVLERFWVKELTVKGLFGLFDYTHMFRVPPDVELFFYDGRWYRQCPHSGIYEPDIPTPAEGGFTIEHFPFWDIITLYSGYIKFIADPHEIVNFNFNVISDGLGVNYFWTDYDPDNRLNIDLSIASRGSNPNLAPGQVIMMGMFDEDGPPVQIEFWGGLPNVGIQAYEGPLFHRIVVPPQGSATFRDHTSLTFSVQNPYWIIRERRETHVFMITAVNTAALEPVTESSRNRAAFAVRPYNLGHSTIITNPLPIPIEFFVPYAWILAGAMTIEIRN